MADIELKRGQTARITFALTDSAGDPFNLAGYTVTLAIAGKGGAPVKRIAATLNSPSSLGTGYFPVVEADYSVLRPGAYLFEVWAYDGDANNIPMLSGTLDVNDVPQRA